MPNVDLSILLSNAFSMLLRKITVPEDFPDQVKAVREMQKDDMSGLVDSLTDFAVNSALVDFTVETENDELTRILKKWLDLINSSYKGQIIASGIKPLAKQYFLERWKYSSFPILKLAGWSDVDGLLLPTKAFFLDGGSVKAKDKDKNSKELKLLNYDYYLGNTSNYNNLLDENVIITKPYGRNFEKYPIPYLIKRGVYHNWKIIDSLKNQQATVLDQVIPYMFLVKKGTEALATNNVKIYQQAEFNELVKQFQDLVDELKVNNTKTEDIQYKSTKSPIRVTGFDEEIKHLIPDLKSIFDQALFAQAERNILAGLGFIDIAQSISESRRESILNPKAFIEECKAGVEDFKQILKEVMLLVIAENKNEHKKYANANMKVVSSPVTTFMSKDFKNSLRLLWSHGQLSNRTYCEMVGETNFEIEKERREKETKDGTEILMYPHQTQNREEQESFEETKRQQEYYDEETEDTDENGNPLPPDKTEPEQKEEYDLSQKKGDHLEGSPYQTIKDLPTRVKNNLSSDLQRVFLSVFNRAYEQYESEDRAFRISWGVIKKIGRKNKRGIWVRKSKRKGGKLVPVKLNRAIVEKVLAKEEKAAIDEAIQSQEAEIREKKNQLLDKLLGKKK